MSHFKKYLDTFKQNYPNSFEYIDHSLLQNLICEVSVPMKQSDLEKIQKLISTLFQASRASDYSKNFQSPEDEKLSHLNVKNYSVLMSYDFHITDDGPKLIEINTNASAYLICDLLYQSFSQKTFLLPLIKSFKSEFLKDSPLIAIIDNHPKKQAMYIEFLMYKELLEPHAKEVCILDYRDIKNDGLINGQPIDFIYNRHTDFYFNDSSHLKNLYYGLNCVFSPQPKEYLLLADKQRLVDLSLKKIKIENESNVLPLLLDTFEMQSFDKEKLWQQKKKYFFKPKTSFGSKSTYHGKSISRKHFERMYDANEIAQAYAPPATLMIGDKKMKTDIRVYAYKDSIQMLAARIYSGQMTNAKDPMGGFARVDVH